MKAIIKRICNELTVEVGHLCTGVQGDKGNKGELFGITNLFRETADKVNAHDIFDQERQPTRYRIQQCDPADMGNAPLSFMHAEWVCMQPP